MKKLIVILAAIPLAGCSWWDGLFRNVRSEDATTIVKLNLPNPDPLDLSRLKQAGYKVETNPDGSRSLVIPLTAAETQLELVKELENRIDLLTQQLLEYKKYYGEVPK